MLEAVTRRNNLQWPAKLFFKCGDRTALRTIVIQQDIQNIGDGSSMAMEYDSGLSPAVITFDLMRKYAHMELLYPSTCFTLAGNNPRHILYGSLVYKIDNRPSWRCIANYPDELKDHPGH